MIGIFDSGSGGLTVLKEIRALAPQCDIVYFGDFVHVPYGEKTPEELGALTVIAVEKLLEEGATEIVSACNSVSASIAQPLIQLLGRKQFGMIEMIGPTVGALKEQAQEGITIGLVATPATVRSGIYHNAFSAEQITIKAIGIPGLTDAIESGADEATLTNIFSSAVDELKKASCSTIILGCTQYPLIKEVFESYSPDTIFFNPAHAVADKVVKRFDTDGNGTLRFLLSQDSDIFRKMVTEFFPEEEYVIEVL